MQKLPGTYFFSFKDFPLAVRKVEGTRLSHLHDYTAVPHYHDFSELVIITKGEGEQSINGKTYHISEGDVFIMLGKTVHYFTDYRNLSILNIMFDHSIFATRLDYLRKIPGYNLIFRIEPSLRSEKSFSNTLHLNREQLAHALDIAEGIENELDTAAPGYEAETAAQFVRLIVWLSRSVGGADVDKAAFHRLSILLSRLEENFGEVWDLDRMTRSVHMSRNNFIRVFKAAQGCTPMKYLEKIRMDAACRLLREKKKNITEIAGLCGFQDSNYFSKRFSATFHRSPREYRKRN